ncbi:MAG: hypothetical protein OXB84_03805 [Halobacteriovoraceae bacterium]|nr:hypothetical protein [Halobacteriovoraceae bacterium]
MVKKTFFFIFAGTVFLACGKKENNLNVQTQENTNLTRQKHPKRSNPCSKEDKNRLLAILQDPQGFPPTPAKYKFWYQTCTVKSPYSGSLPFGFTSNSPSSPLHCLQVFRSYNENLFFHELADSKSQLRRILVDKARRSDDRYCELNHDKTIYRIEDPETNHLWDIHPGHPLFAQPYKTIILD